MKLNHRNRKEDCMADMNITQLQTPVQNAGMSQKSAVQAEIKTDNRKEIGERNRQEEEKRKQLEEERLENVIAVSEDGDTVQASEESRSKLESEEEEDRNAASDAVKPPVEEDRNAASDAVKPPVEGVQDKDQAVSDNGKIVVTENTVNDRIEEENEERERRQQILEDISLSSERAMSVRDLFKAAADRGTNETVNQEQQFQKVNSFTGYSDAQLQQMYRKGEISRQEYDREINSREEEREKEQEEQKDLNREVTGEARLLEENQREGRGIKIAFSEDASDTIRPEDRVDMIQKANENFSLN